MTKLQEDTTFRVLRVLKLRPQVTQRELAAGLGVSLGVTNYVLRALLDKGAIKIKNFRGNSQKLTYAYVLTPSGLAEKAVLTARFLARKQKEYAALRLEIEAVRKELEKEKIPLTGTADTP